VAIEILNLTKRKIDASHVERIAEAALGQTKGEGEISLSVVFVGEKRMRDLNREYHGKDAATDVLSFSSSKNFPSGQINGKFIGEVFVCPSVINHNSSKLGISSSREFAHVIIHGVLHLLGYEHESSEKKHEEMHSLEEEIMSRLKV